MAAQSSDQDNCVVAGKRQHNPVKVTKRVLETIFLIVSIALTIGLFSIPIAFYVRGVHGTPEPTNFTLTTANCSSLSWVTGGTGTATECSAVPYNGSVCSEQLSVWQQCALGRGGAATVSAATSYIDKDEMLINFLTVLESSGADCRSIAVPAICQFAYPLCDATSEKLYTLSQEQCLRISQHDCHSEWTIALSLGYGNILPNCSLLQSSNDTIINSFVPSPVQNITCHEDFFLSNGTCVPRCGSWKVVSEEGDRIERIIQALATAIGIVASIALLIASIVRYKFMLKFPAILVVYVTIGCLVVGITSFVSLLERESSKLFCSSDNVITSIANPTPFCVITGVVYHYFHINITLWVFFHTSILFYKVLYPFHAKARKERMKYVHLAMVVTGLLVPLIGILVVVIDDKYKYTVQGFPQTFCIPNDGTIYFWFIMLPVIVALVMTVCQLIIVIWLVHKHQGLFRPKGKATILLISTAEKKLLIVVIYYILFGVFVMAYYSVSIIDNRALESAIKSYFICEASGFVPGQCDRTTFEQYFLGWFPAIAFILISLLPLVNMIYVVHFKKIRTMISSHCKRKSKNLNNKISNGTNKI